MFLLCCVTNCFCDIQDLSLKQKYLVTFTVGYKQRENVNAAVQKVKFSEDHKIETGNTWFIFTLLFLPIWIYLIIAWVRHVAFCNMRFLVIANFIMFKLLNRSPLKSLWLTAGILILLHAVFWKFYHPTVPLWRKNERMGWVRVVEAGYSCEHQKADEMVRLISCSSVTNYRCPVTFCCFLISGGMRNDSCTLTSWLHTSTYSSGTKILQSSISMPKSKPSPLFTFLFFFCCQSWFFGFISGIADTLSWRKSTD